MSMPLTPLSGGVLLPYECHEGNLAVRNALSAERAEDRASPRTWPKASRPRRGAESGVGGGNRGRGGIAARRAGGRGGRGGDPEDAN